jgi:glycogen operon protein
MPHLPLRMLAGHPAPLGASWDGLGVNFAVFSAHATRIELCLFDPSGRREIARYDLPDCTDEVFHGYLPDVGPGLLFGYRAHGPFQPENGHRFNPNKLLLDPYARAFSGAVRWNDTLFGYRVGSPRGDLSFDRRDSAAAMPKSVVTANENPMWGDHRPPRRSWQETVIYETHVRSLSMQRDDLEMYARGTFAALADPRLIDHLVKLGITAIELLPLHAYLQDRFLVERKLSNYWGYSTLCFFAPEPRYFADQANIAHEMRATIRRLHAAGIEVILDVVYNHTCEGNELGATLSWRGLDNASYYRLIPGHERHYINDTGTGNTLNLSHPRVLQMVLDSLRFWATSYSVDGFRFDLGSTLGREDYGFDPGCGFFDALRQDPVLSTMKLISEPWDVGPGGYQLGNHPPGFAEWNDKFRDAVRRYWRGDSMLRPEISARLMGSSELFERRRRGPWASINFVTAHDGAPLHDLVTYTERHNEANGEDGRDGAPDNLSANWGAEGETEDPAINALRDRVARAILATLFISHGTPMLLGGDEIGRTQGGNNNAYCQDNEISWYDWRPVLQPHHRHGGGTQDLIPFIARLAALRRAHPTLCSARFLHGQQELLPGVPDVAWFDEGGNLLTQAAWEDPAAKLLAVRRAAVLDATNGTVDVTLALLNASAEDRDFVFPLPQLPWDIALDTAEPARQEQAFGDSKVAVRARSLMLLVATARRTPA